MKLASLIKKEFHRFFHDPRLIFSLLLPGVVIFLLYSFLGSVMNDEPLTYEYKVYLSGESAVTSFIEEAAISDGSQFTWLKVESEEVAVAAVEKGEATAYIAFSENFDNAETASVDIYYTSKDDGAGEAFYAVSSAILQSYGMRFAVIPHSFMTEQDLGMTIMQSILPMLVVSFVFSACMSVTLESVAGEKERGTLTTILATSVKRSHIALGKIIPLCCIAALGAASSFIGVALSLPKMMGISLDLFIGAYGFMSYLLLFLSIVGLVPLIVSLISVVSAFSRSVKEASAYTSIVMVLMMVTSLVTSFIPSMGNWAVAVPGLNAVFMMQKILSGSVPVLLTLLTFGLNLVYSTLLVLAIAKMLSSERIMFGK